MLNFGLKFSQNAWETHHSSIFSHIYDIYGVFTKHLRKILHCLLEICHFEVLYFLDKNFCRSIFSSNYGFQICIKITDNYFWRYFGGCTPVLDTILMNCNHFFTPILLKMVFKNGTILEIFLLFHTFRPPLWMFRKY